MAVETLDEALKFVDELLSSSDKRKITKLVQQWGIEDAIAQLHHGLGTKLRNELLLWAPEGAKLRDDVWKNMPEATKQTYIGYWAQFGAVYDGTDMHADDCSTEIMRAYFTKLMETK